MGRNIGRAGPTPTRPGPLEPLLAQRRLAGETVAQALQALPCQHLMTILPTQPLSHPSLKRLFTLQTSALTTPTTPRTPCAGSSPNLQPGCPEQAPHTVPSPHPASAHPSTVPASPAAGPAVTPRPSPLPTLTHTDSLTSPFPRPPPCLGSGPHHLLPNGLQATCHRPRQTQKTSTAQKRELREFPGGPVVGTLCSTAGGPGSTPGRGTRIPQAMRYSQIN